MPDIYTRSKGLFIALSVCTLCWQGCNIINPTEPIPTYIHIDSFHFVQNSALRPVNLALSGNPLYLSPVPTSHQTNVAWVYYNNNPVGIFDLPVTFPVIATGNGVLEVAPAIIEDGENNSIAAYPFYTIDTFSFTAQPGATINHTPQTGFYTDTKIGVISYFLSNAQSYFAPWEGSLGIMKIVAGDSVYPGKTYSGVIQLSTLFNPAIDSAIDSSTFSFPIDAGDAYIEFDYNSTVPFYVGLQANLSSFVYSTPTYLTGIYPNNGWEKFYFKVDGFTATAQATSYNLYIKAVLSPGQVSGRLLIDNIQLVSF